MVVSSWAPGSLVLLVIALAACGASPPAQPPIDDPGGGSSSGSSSGSTSSSGSSSGFTSSSGSTSGGGSITLSCLASDGGECTDFLDLTTYPGFCSLGTGSTAPCPSANRVGSCDVPPVLGQSRIVRYYSPSYTATSAQADCSAQSGTWVPG